MRDIKYMIVHRIVYYISFRINVTVCDVCPNRLIKFSYHNRHSVCRYFPCLCDRLITVGQVKDAQDMVESKVKILDVNTRKQN